VFAWGDVPNLVFFWVYNRCLAIAVTAVKIIAVIIIREQLLWARSITFKDLHGAAAARAWGPIFVYYLRAHSLTLYGG